MKNKQTAVEWFIEQIESGKIEIVYSNKIHSIKCIPEISEQAKEMFEKQMIDFAYSSIREVESELGDLIYKKVPEEIYNETYGGNK